MGEQRIVSLMDWVSLTFHLGRHIEKTIFTERLCESRTPLARCAYSLGALGKPNLTLWAHIVNPPSETLVTYSLYVLLSGPNNADVNIIYFCTPWYRVDKHQLCLTLSNH